MSLILVDSKPITKSVIAMIYFRECLFDAIGKKSKSVEIKGCAAAFKRLGACRYHRKEGVYQL